MFCLVLYCADFQVSLSKASLKQFLVAMVELDWKMICESEPLLTMFTEG